jgi:hypothetical protein
MNVFVLNLVSNFGKRFRTLLKGKSKRLGTEPSVEYEPVNGTNVIWTDVRLSTESSGPPSVSKNEENSSENDSFQLFDHS